MYSVFRFERPQASSLSPPVRTTAAGVIRGTAAATRSHTACAALTEICCPVIARASVTNGSPRLTRKPSGCFGISRLRMRSRWIRSARASCQ